LILLIIYVASVAVAVKTDNGELATHAGWLLIAIVVLVIVSRVMRWSWNSRQP
jgi:cell division protein FtsW (lipid II flippase)